MQPNDYACPVCGARNMAVDLFTKPVFVEFDDAGNQKFCSGTYYCSVCSKDGMIVKYKKVAHE